MDINNSDFALCLTVTKPVGQCHLENNDCRFKTKRNVLVQNEAYNLKNVSTKTSPLVKKLEFLSSNEPYITDLWICNISTIMSELGERL